MTKAEKIYTATRSECRRFIKTWGYQTNPDGSAVGYNGVIYGDDEFVCNRTLNAVEKLLTSERKRIETSLRLEVISEARYTELSQILNSVETCIRNSRKSIND